MKGLEPIRLATLAPKTSAYTNSATSACHPLRPINGVGGFGLQR
jgi:hypothetical protein